MNSLLLLLPQRYIFSSKSQLEAANPHILGSCCCYHKGTYFQANHNKKSYLVRKLTVVVATTKVHIFKQITTDSLSNIYDILLLLLPQRYIFSSKSQLIKEVYLILTSCCCYHKGTYFQANHNCFEYGKKTKRLLLLPQRYIFSSKSQLNLSSDVYSRCCCCYHKGTYFQANHNYTFNLESLNQLLLLPQRYIFSSKSQRTPIIPTS